MDVVCCFAVGISNFGGGRQRAPEGLADAIMGALEGRGHLIATYGATGNFAITTESTRTHISPLLRDEVGIECAVVTAKELEEKIDALALLRPPGDEPGTRWTPGLAFAVAPGDRDDLPRG